MIAPPSSILIYKNPSESPTSVWGMGRGRVRLLFTLVGISINGVTSVDHSPQSVH